MYKLIAILRIVGLLSFLAFIVSLFFGNESQMFTYFSNRLQRSLILVAMICFAITFALQLYQFYIKNYLQKNTDEEDI